MSRTIHHAADGSGIVGIRPHLSIHVRSPALEETDGWMLRGGMQDVHNTRLAVVPAVRAARPSRARLERRYQQFVDAG